ncbi:MAG: PP2C family protein-serine/threonine phosphatase [Acidobacteria bacterium]|nr:PP2C family protein-serine/threonine phosphatase [Acidobacteriota bacterium]
MAGFPVLFQVLAATDLRSDMVAVLVGFLLGVLGLFSIIVAAVRWRSGDLSMVSFGSFCLLYGVRLMAGAATLRVIVGGSAATYVYLGAIITYVAPVPFAIFAQEFIGRGWRSSVRRMVQIAVAYAVLSVTVVIASRDPSLPMVANNPLVVAAIMVMLGNLYLTGLRMTRELRVLRAGFLILGLFSLHENLAPLMRSSPRRGIEWMGVLLFVCCLGYVAARKFFASERHLLAISQELATARRIQASILPRSMPEIQGVEIGVRYLPMTSVAGDFYDFIAPDDNHLGILLADVSGHGVPAALIASMVKVAFQSQAPYAADPGRVLGAMNQIFTGQLEREFITAGYLWVDAQARSITYAGAGHPLPLVWRSTEKRILELSQNGVPLGLFPSVTYDAVQHGIAPGDRIVLFTDGVPEAANVSCEYFGVSRLSGFLESHVRQDPKAFLDAFFDHLAAWSGRGDGFDDDVTMLVVVFPESERTTDGTALTREAGGSPSGRTE